jgi:L-malate glycosyltransferase
MNVIVISHTYIAAVNQDKWTTLARLYPDDVNLIVIIPTLWPTHLFIHKAGTENNKFFKNCQFVALPVINAGNEVKYRFRLTALFKILKKYCPEIIQIEQGDTAFSFLQAILLTKLLRLKTKFMFFTWINWRPPRSWKDILFWQWIGKLNRYFSYAAIVGNNEAKNILIEKKFNKPIMVLPQLGINTDIFRPGTLLKKNIIGFVGRLVSEKGVDLLIKAFFRLHKYFPEWKLMIVGDGPEKKSLQNLVTTLSQKDVIPGKKNVIPGFDLGSLLQHKPHGSRIGVRDDILGVRNDNLGVQNDPLLIQENFLSNIIFNNVVTHKKVASLVQTFSMLVLPSYDTPLWKEQFGHVLIEAMACSVPVIGSNAGEIPHVIKKSGLLFKQKNVTSLYRCLAKLMGNEQLRNQLGKAGVERVQQHYTHQVVAQKTYNWWKKVL